MSRCNKLQILFCIEILVGFCNAIVENRGIVNQVLVIDEKVVENKNEFPQLKWVEVENVTVETFPDTLFIEFNYYGTNTSVTLEQVEDQELIGRNSTGFWLAESNANAYHNVSYTPMPDIFDRIGNIDFYVDLETLSAVTRFWNSTTREEIFIGVLMQNYTINCTRGNFKDGVIYLIPSPPLYTKFYTPKLVNVENPEVMQVNVQQASTPDEDVHFVEDLCNITGSKNSEPIYSPKVVYPKLLLAPSYDIVMVQKTSEEIVRNLIAFMHAEDMLYRLLKDPKIRLHISGIIIPQDEFATPYIPTVKVDNLYDVETLHTSERYFTAEEHRFPFHTYDIIVNLLPNGVFRSDGRSLAGVAYRSLVCRMERTRGKGAVIIARYELDFLHSFSVLAHELAHSFNATHDAGDIPYVMTDTADIPTSGWSQRSKESISYFFKTEWSPCTHSRPYQVPDTVKHLPGAWMSVTGQCQNQFKDALGDCRLNDCESYACQRKDSCDQILGREPMQGIVCGKGKRCIDRRCQNETIFE